MTTQQLINKSLALIRETLCRVKKPVVAWSGGKDSQVMLHLIRHVILGDSSMPTRHRQLGALHVRILRIRGFEHPQKHAFGDSIVKYLGLDVIPAKPVSTDVVGNGDHVEIVEEYRLNDRVALYFPIEPEPDHVPGPGSHCAVEKLNQPCDGEALGVDGIFIGHRSDDTDLMHGPIPLEEGVVEDHGVLFVYPLKDWSEADIWAASELLDIPQNKARYVRKDMSANADYFPMCVECLKPTDAESVICPKIGEPVYAIGRDLNLEQRREEWRNKFVNLKREQ
jgi:3'-phosphoadenosine 5'-phosphosulfate sulfotransferase (PAPS reductase)/FAD synthetase